MTRKIVSTSSEPCPLQHLCDLDRDYPGIWTTVADLRSRRGVDLPEWPKWCYLPLAGAYAIASGGRQLDPRRASDVARIGAFAAWRTTKGIYRIDKTLWENLSTTLLTGHLRDQLFERLPDWCVYIDLSETRDGAGFYERLSKQYTL